VAEGADVPLLDAVPDASCRCPPDVCVAVVLGDALHRVSVLAGREGLARSLGSVYGGAVTLFLGDGWRGRKRRAIAMPGVKPEYNGLAVRRDGSTLLVSDSEGGSIHEFSVAHGSRLRVVGEPGDGPLQFWFPCQVYVACDDFVFVADRGNKRVQVLTPRLDFHGFVGVGQLRGPAGVCANADIVVVSEAGHRLVVVFRRSDGAVLREFGDKAYRDVDLNWPLGLCFVAGHRHVAIADENNNRVSVFSVDGEFIRHVDDPDKCGWSSQPGVACGLACSASDELLFGTGDGGVAVFSPSGKLVTRFGRGRYPCVAIHSSTVFAHNGDSKCIVFE
jgi:sugar lactone lactonase YvrE